MCLGLLVTLCLAAPHARLYAKNSMALPSDLKPGSPFKPSKTDSNSLSRRLLLNDKERKELAQLSKDHYQQMQSLNRSFRQQVKALLGEERFGIWTTLQPPKPPSPHVRVKASGSAD